MRNSKMQDNFSLEVNKTQWTYEFRMDLIAFMIEFLDELDAKLQEGGHV